MNVEARLRAFAAVAREKSFSRAAETLFVSQPAVSKHVASLESELGATLVVRGRPGVTLTPAGEVLADYVLRAEALLANARRALASGADSEVGVLSIAASGIPGTYLLPQLVSRFHGRRPAVEIDFRVATSGGALDLVRSHAVELAVVGGMTVPPELESEPLIEDEVVLIGPPALGGRRLQPKDLERQTWISREEGSATRAAVEAARWQIGLPAVRELELPSWEAVKLAVANGAGIAAISRFALGFELDSGALVVLNVSRWRLSRTISVVRAADVPLTPPAERFLALLRDHFRPVEEPLPWNSNLPAVAAPLFGRATELAEVADALGNGRFVTLTGPGGSGKTRLATAAATAAVDRYADGVYFVDLTPIREADRVLTAVAATLASPDVPAMRDRLSTQTVLLVLDNFEQVVDAAPAIADVLDEAVGVSVLVTSRVPLRVRGEYVVGVRPLRPEDAVALFHHAAGAVRTDPAIARICARVDYLPLAVELAAARSNVLAPSDLLAQLDTGLDVLRSSRRDVDARQQTLRQTIAWSCDLLGDDARALLARLAVFVGGWSLEAAAAVCAADLDALAELVDHNLVRRDADRFTMLDTIHAFAAESLEASGEEDALRRAHAEYFATFAETAAPHLRAEDQAEWFARVAEEAENVRAAVSWANRAGERELQLRIAGAAWQYWIGLGGRDEWRSWLEEGLQGVRDPQLRLLALRPLSWLALRADDDGLAEKYASERIALGRSMPSDHDVAGGNSVLSVLAERRGDLERARELAETAVAIDRRSGDIDALVAHLSNLGGLLLRSGDLARAKGLFEESGSLASEHGDEVLAASAGLSLALVALLERDGRTACELVERNIRPAVSSGNDSAIWFALDLFGVALVEIGRTRGGTKLLAAAERLRRARGEAREPFVAELRDQVTQTAREQLGADAFEGAYAEGESLDVDAAIEIGLNRASGS